MVEPPLFLGDLLVQLDPGQGWRILDALGGNVDEYARGGIERLELPCHRIDVRVLAAAPVRIDRQYGKIQLRELLLIRRIPIIVRTRNGVGRETRITVCGEY